MITPIDPLGSSRAGNKAHAMHKGEPGERQNAPMCIYRLKSGRQTDECVVALTLRLVALAADVSEAHLGLSMKLQPADCVYLSARVCVCARERCQRAKLFTLSFQLGLAKVHSFIAAAKSQPIGCRPNTQTDTLIELKTSSSSHRQTTTTTLLPPLAE